VAVVRDGRAWAQPSMLGPAQHTSHAIDAGTGCGTRDCTADSGYWPARAPRCLGLWTSRIRARRARDNGVGKM